MNDLKAFTTIRCVWCGRAEGKGYYQECKGIRSQTIFGYGGQQCSASDGQRYLLCHLCPYCYETYHGLCMADYERTLPPARIEGLAERKLDIGDQFDQAVDWGAP